MNYILIYTDGKVVIGRQVLDYVVPVQEFPTLAEYADYVNKLVKYTGDNLDFLEKIFSRKVGDEFNPKLRKELTEILGGKNGNL